MNEILFCEDCQCVKQKSIVQLITKTHGSGRSVFYDEDGEKHIHDESFVQILYSCSKGHNWEKLNYGKCINENCEWNGKSITTEN